MSSAANSPDRIFILGAGFSHHLSHGKFPLTIGLSEKISNTHYKKYAESSQDIEVVLSQIDLSTLTDIEKDQVKYDVFTEIQKSLSVVDLYDDTSFDWEKSKKQKSKKLVKDLFRPGDTIITFNYDVLLEHLLCLNYQDDSENPLFNYGKVFDARLQSGEEGYAASKRNDDEPISGIKLPPNSKKITILKPHGSFNFLPFSFPEDNHLPDDTCSFGPIFDMSYRETRGYEANGWIFHPPAFLDGVKAAEKGTEFLFKGVVTSSYSDPTNLSQNRRNMQIPKVILPTFVKSIGNRELQRIWELAYKKIMIDTPLQVIMIGCSLPDEDSLTRNLLNLGRGERYYRILGGGKNIKAKMASLGLANPNNRKIYGENSELYDDQYAELVRNLLCPSS